MLIITPDYDESESEALTENVKGLIENSGTILDIDVWGKRQLAYPIQKCSEGYYVVFVFESPPSFIAQLNQSLRVIEAILRHMIVLYEGDIEKLKAAQASRAEAEKTDAAPDDDAAEDTAPDNDAAEDAAPDKDAAEDAAPDKDAAEDAAPDKDAAEDAAPDNDAAEDAAPDRDAAEDATESN